MSECTIESASKGLILRNALPAHGFLQALLALVNGKTAGGEGGSSMPAPLSSVRCRDSTHTSELPMGEGELIATLKVLSDKGRIMCTKDEETNEIDPQGLLYIV